MRILKAVLFCLVVAVTARANQRAQGFCEVGGQPVITQGLNSTTTVQASYPLCTVTVFVDGSETVATATYLSGGAITGTATQTCSLFFVGGTGAVGTIPLTGTNAIANGTAITVNTGGSGFIGPPTTATLGNGTATCSGTAIISSTVTGTLATIYSDNNNTPLSNPFTSTAQGYWWFYAANGRYDPVISGASIPGGSFMFSDVLLNDPANNTLYVKNYTPCNGSSDDTGGIQTAINVLIGQGGGTLSFSQGQNCTLASYNSGSGGNVLYSLLFNGAGGNYYFDGNGATISSSLSTDSSSTLTAEIFVTGTFTGLYVKGLNFVSTHATTAGDTSAISMFGPSGTGSIGYLSVTSSTFTNFSRALNVQGYQAAHIGPGNRFLSQYGHNSGSTSTNPNVAVWAGADFADNSSISTYNTTIEGNYFNGCSISLGTSTDCLDGMIYGQSNGWDIYDNNIVNHGVEAIYVEARPWQWGGSPSSPTHASSHIHDNLIDDSEPSGAAVGNYCIRSDESDMTIEANVCRFAIRGIIVDTYNVATPNTNYNVTVRHNTIEMNPSVPSGTMGDPSEYGMHFNNSDDLLSEGNRIHWQGGYANANTLTNNAIQGVIVGNAGTNMVFKGDVVESTQLTSQTNKLYAYWFQQVTNITLDGDYAIYADYGVYTTVTSPNITIPSITFTNVTTPISGNIGNILWTNQTLTFTPGATQTGYWRLWSGIPTGNSYIAGRLRVAGSYDNANTDDVFEFDCTGYSFYTSQINIVRFLNYNAGVLKSLRCSNNASSTIYLDFNVRTATTPGPITFYLENNTLPGFILTPPTYNPSVGSYVAEAWISPGFTTTANLNGTYVAGGYDSGHTTNNATIAVGAAAGSGATAVVYGDGNSGTGTITLGAGTAPGVLATVTLPGNPSPNCVVVPQSGAAITGLYVQSLSANIFTINTTGSLGTNPTFNYVCGGQHQ